MSLTNGAGQFRFWYVATAVVLGVKSTSGKDFIMAVGSWPEAFAAKQVTVTGGTQYVRLGGRGPAVLLLHGFDDTGDMWVPLAEALVKDHAVVVPDLRGMGLSSMIFIRPILV